MKQRFLLTGLIGCLLPFFQPVVAGDSASHSNTDVSTRPLLTQGFTAPCYGAIIDGGAKDVKIEVRQLEDEEQEIRAYREQIKTLQKIYQRKLPELLAHFKPITPPSWHQGPSVTDATSYTVLAQPHRSSANFLASPCQPSIKLSPHEEHKHELVIPTHDSVLPYDLHNMAPHTAAEAEGWIRYALADATSFLSENNRRKHERITTIIELGLLASWLLPTGYLIYQDVHQSVSIEKIIGHLVASIATQYVTNVPVYYGLNTWHASKRQREHIELDQRASDCPTDHDIDPLIISLVHTHASQEMIKAMKTLQRREGSCAWLRCGLVYDVLMRCWQHPKHDTDAPDRITALLETSYRKLEQKLKAHGADDSKQTAAQRITAAYQRILDNSYALHPRNLPYITRHTNIALKLNDDQRELLTQRMRTLRNTLDQCWSYNLSYLR